MATPKKKPTDLARVKSLYHTGTQMAHRRRSDENRMKKLTPCGVSVFKCVKAKKAACRKRSRQLVAEKMGLRLQDMAALYPNHDVHHEKRMTYKAVPGCSCTLSCPLSRTTLVPSSWNRGVMKKYETQVQRGFSFDDQIKGVRKSKNGSDGIPPPARPSTALSSSVTPLGTCRARPFATSIDHRVETRAYANYVKMSTKSRSARWFASATRTASVESHTIPQLLKIGIAGAGLHLLLPKRAAHRDVGAPRQAKLLPIVVLRDKSGKHHLLDGRRRIRDAHTACPARATIAVLLLIE